MINPGSLELGAELKLIYDLYVAVLPLNTEATYPLELTGAKVIPPVKVPPPKGR
jgi:hypothetical protein